MALDRRRRRGVGVGGSASGEEFEEAAQVPPLGRLELRRQAHQLADVGEAGLARGPHQHREVVPGRGDDDVDQLAQWKRRRPRAELGEGRGKAGQQCAVGGVDAVDHLGVEELRLPASG